MLAVKTTDISFAERKILIYLGEKNFRGRAVYFSEDAEKAVQQWLEVRNKDSDYLFPSPVNIGRSSISYVAAWSAMRRLLDCADELNRFAEKPPHQHSLHSCRWGPPKGGVFQI